MKIIKTSNWNRRDFEALLECESCKTIEVNKYCYDDANFYDNVVPDFKCKKCGESTNSLGTQKDNVTPKYNPNIVM